LVAVDTNLDGQAVVAVCFPLVFEEELRPRDPRRSSLSLRYWLGGRTT